VFYLPKEKEYLPVMKEMDKLFSAGSEEEIQETLEMPSPTTRFLLERRVQDIKEMAEKAEQAATVISPLVDGEKSVVLSNRFTVAEENCSRLAFKLSRVVISQIRMEDNELKPVTITTNDMKRMGYSGSRLTGHMSSVLDEILNYRIKIAYEHEGGGKKAGKMVGINVFTTAVCNGGKGSITVLLNPVLKEHFLNLQREFLQYGLAEVLSLNGYASSKLHEILLSQARRFGGGAQVLRFSIDYLAKVLNYSSQRDYRPSEFVRNCIDRAVEDINKNTSCVVRYKALREGKSFHYVRFYVMDYETMERKQRLQNIDRKDSEAVSAVMDALSEEYAEALLESGEGEIPIDFP